MDKSTLLVFVSRKGRGLETRNLLFYLDFSPFNAVSYNGERTVQKRRKACKFIIVAIVH